MTEKNSKVVRLDAYQNATWTSSDVPVAILNTNSTLHDRIAYSWALANQLHVLSDLLVEHDNQEVRNVAALFCSQLMPLEAMLKTLGFDTRLSDGSQPDSEKL